MSFGMMKNLHHGPLLGPFWLMEGPLFIPQEWKWEHYGFALWDTAHFSSLGTYDDELFCVLCLSCVCSFYLSSIYMLCNKKKNLE